MRIRKNPRALEFVCQHPDIVIFRPQEYKGKWREYFEKHCGNKPDASLKIEIGMGKGKFITESAMLNKTDDFIGIDLRPEIMMSALKKVLEHDIGNVLLVPLNAANIEDAFAPGEVDTLYLNFSDPWPKARHAKRRLTHSLFLERYKKILKKGSEIILKTDSRSLFDFSVEEFQKMGFEITELTHDLHSCGCTDNITTEYEEKFMELGIKINRLKAINV